MKVKCKTTVALAREPGKPHIQLYKDTKIDLPEEYALRAIELGIAEHCNEICEKMVSNVHENKMMNDISENKEIRRGRPKKAIKE